MNITGDDHGVVKPDLVRRSCGGWLAIAPKGAKFVIGVTSPTSVQAEEKFRSVFARWVSIREEAAN